MGDIGDYIKYALLRAIMRAEPDKKLGVAWYLTPDDNRNDGLHTGYLHAPQKWQHLDSELFDFLWDLVCKKRNRSVKAIEESDIFDKNNTVFFDEELSIEGDLNLLQTPSKPSHTEKAQFREKWFDGLLARLKDCGVVFADPDNGFYPDTQFSYGSRGMWKRLPLSEAVRLAKGRVGVFYHHNTRRKGGHIEEIKFWKGDLQKSHGIEQVLALKASAGSVRTFFVVNPNQKLASAIYDFAERLKQTRCKVFLDKI